MQSLAAKNFFRLDYFLAKLTEADAAFLAFGLKPFVGFGFIEIESLHEDALGFFDELSRFQGLGEVVFFQPKALLVAETLQGDFDLGGKTLGGDRLDEVAKNTDFGGAGDEGLVAESADHDHWAAALFEQFGGKFKPIGFAQANIEQDKIRLLVEVHHPRFGGRACLPDDGVTQLRELGAMAHADDGFILDDEDSERFDEDRWHEKPFNSIDSIQFERCRWFARKRFAPMRYRPQRPWRTSRQRHGLFLQSMVGIVKHGANDLIEGEFGRETDCGADSIELGNAAREIVEGSAVGDFVGDVFDSAGGVG